MVKMFNPCSPCCGCWPPTRAAYPGFPTLADLPDTVYLGLNQAVSPLVRTAPDRWEGELTAATRASRSVIRVAAPPYSARGADETRTFSHPVRVTAVPTVGTGVIRLVPEVYDPGYPPANASTNLRDRGGGWWSMGFNQLIPAANPYPGSAFVWDRALVPFAVGGNPFLYPDTEFRQYLSPYPAFVGAFEPEMGAGDTAGDSSYTGVFAPDTDVTKPYRNVHFVHAQPPTVAADGGPAGNHWVPTPLACGGGRCATAALTVRLESEGADVEATAFLAGFGAADRADVTSPAVADLTYAWSGPVAGGWFCGIVRFSHVTPAAPIAVPNDAYPWGTTRRALVALACRYYRSTDVTVDGFTVLLDDGLDYTQAEVAYAAGPDFYPLRYAHAEGFGCDERAAVDLPGSVESPPGTVAVRKEASRVAVNPAATTIGDLLTTTPVAARVSFRCLGDPRDP